MHPIKEILKTRDWARRFIPAEGSLRSAASMPSMVEITQDAETGEILTANGVPLRREKAAWTTAAQRDEFLIEERKQCILSDYHALQDSIGKQAARSFILEEVDPITYDHA